ncbi:MAG: hypothetical protein ACTJG2_01785 [Candidatus Saccharimonadales bacterium]
MSSHKKGGSIASLLCLVVVLAIAGWVFWQRQYLLDQIQVWQFTPSEEVSALADRTTMNDRGRFLYYVAHPSLETSETFNTHCERQEGSSPILGCYRNGRIYVYDITDERLDGIKEVTAAHEMLHVAYERLSDSEKTRINALLEAEYKNHATEALQERMEYYARTQPGQRTNELHSIIGTEIADISDELEAYYKTYFTDRPTIAKLFAGYNAKFEEVKNEANALRAELESLEASINQQTEAYERALQVLNRDITAFNERAEAGEFTNQSEFDAARAQLVARAQSIETQRSTIEGNINDYNTKQKLHNSLVDESNSLQESIDSELTPAPQLQGATQ